jgi:hypothetical protein
MSRLLKSTTFRFCILSPLSHREAKLSRVLVLTLVMLFLRFRKPMRTRKITRDPFLSLCLQSLRASSSTLTRFLIKNCQKIKLRGYSTEKIKKNRNHRLYGYKESTTLEPLLLLSRKSSSYLLMALRSSRKFFFLLSRSGSSSMTKSKITRLTRVQRGLFRKVEIRRMM